MRDGIERVEGTWETVPLIKGLLAWGCLADTSK